MYFYFFSEFPAIVKLQGIYYGKIGNTVKFCKIDKPYPLVEVCSLNGNDNFTFFLEDDFLLSPPPFVSVTDMKGGYLIKFKQKPQKSEFKVIEQKNFGDATFTLFCDDGYKVSFETPSGFFAESLDFSPLSANVTRGEGTLGDFVFAEFICNDTKILSVYSVKTQNKLLHREIFDYSLYTYEFTTVERVKDIAKHEVKTKWIADENALKEQTRTVLVSEKFDKNSLIKEIIPYAFCEEYAVGGDYAFYLADGIKENADKLKGFFGDIIGVTTPPLFRDPLEIGLVKKTGDRLYGVNYFKFFVEDKKITNIIPAEDGD